MERHRKGGKKSKEQVSNGVWVKDELYSIFWWSRMHNRIKTSRLGCIRMVTFFEASCAFGGISDGNFFETSGFWRLNKILETE